MDLRKELASSIVISGGTAMLPGFIARVHQEVAKLLQPPPSLPAPDPQDDGEEPISPTTPRPGATFAPSSEAPNTSLDTPSSAPPNASASAPLDVTPSAPPDARSNIASGASSEATKAKPRLRLLRKPYDPYETLRPLAPFIAILNHPNPPLSSTQSSIASRSAGKAPGFAPVALAWVGASLTGYVLYT